jgi:nucleotide-binding universal stress UspA family protein
MRVVWVMTERCVVVGVSDSPANARTLAWAVREAAATGATLVVTRADVNKPEVWGAVARGSLRALEIVDRTLARAVAAARVRLGDQRVVIVVDRDPPGELLVHRARPGGLIVLGPPGHAGWWARGSTTYYSATHAPCPVVVVHESTEPAGDGVSPHFRDHVVVGVDGSPAAREALGFAFAFAAEHDRPLAAVYVLRHLENDVWFDDTMLETHLATDPDEARALAEEIEPWHYKYPAVKVKRALVAGRPAEWLRLASAGAALLVAGTAGGGPAALGSVSRGLIEQAYCPVAIVRGTP